MSALDADTLATQGPADLRTFLAVARDLIV